MSVTQSQIKQPLFALGRLVATPGALELLTRSEQTALEFLARHSRGDWGDCCPEDASENDFSVKAGFRIFSVYRTNGKLIRVIFARPFVSEERFFYQRRSDKALANPK